MKPLLVLARITFVGCLWSIIFIEGVRVIVLENWRFDIFWPPHWAYAYNLWMSGWVIDTPKEWAFVLILLTFIPLWLTGWIALSLVPWEKIIYKIVTLPVKLIKGSVEPLKYATMPTPVVQKRKSYKEVRPTGKRVPIYDYSAPQAVPVQVTPQAQTPAPATATPALSYDSNPTKNRATATREALNHTIFDIDDGSDDFDLDIDSFDKSDIFKIDSEKNKKQAAVDDFDDEEPYQAPPRHFENTKPAKKTFDMDDYDDDDVEEYRPARSSKPKRDSRDGDIRAGRSKNERYDRQNRSDNDRHSKRDSRDDKPQKSGSSNATVSMLEDNGYTVLKNVQIKRTTIDYMGVSDGTIVLCMFDNEPGDWLADEERFNDEEPLWFSENSHRISPVRKIELARDALEEAVRDTDIDCEIKPYLVISAANIINAEDMLDVWAEMDINVVRVSRGGPTELKPFAKAIDAAEKPMSRDDMAELKKILKQLNPRKD